MNSAALNLGILLAFVSSLGSGMSFAQVQAGKELQVHLSLISVEPSSLRFLVKLKNVGDHDLMLNLGTMLGNGHTQYLDAIHFSLKGSSGGLLSLDLIGPALIAGRVDPLIVPLPVGAQYTLPVNLNNYCACKQRVWQLSPLNGRYTLQAHYQGAAIPQNGTNLDMRGVALFPIWTGHVSSQNLSFYAKEENAKPRHH